ncbi:MAG: diguanylate cyclase [Gammaproteobacteria bacterium]|nr:diguanylate cyclase [Gammaproteobacteria bacterium]
MNTSNESVQAEAWKRKYYDALEQAEAKDRQWAQADDLLRKTLSRLTLAADGQDTVLDRQLKELRDAIRDRADSRQLRQRIEAMSESLVRLDSKRAAKAKAEAPRPAAPLQSLLDKLDLPRGYGRRVKTLRKNLESTQDSDVAALVTEFAALLKEILAEIQPAAAAEPTGGGGLFGRLFGRGGAAATPDQRAEAKPEPAPAVPPVTLTASAEPVAVGPDSARELLLHLLDHLPANFPSRANELRTQALRADSENALKQLAVQLAESFRIDLPATEPASAPTSETIGASGGLSDNGGELLLQLLERLDLPADLEPRIAAIKDRLEDRAGFDAPNVLRDIATLIADMRARLQQEKVEIETFLKQLTDRLQDIDSYVRGAEYARVEAYQSGRDLGEAVQEQVRGIEHSVREAQSLDHLKQAVQQRIDAIITHVDQHRRGEEQRHQEVEAQVVQLTGRLHEMEAESAQLRERIVQERRHALTDVLTGIPNRLAYQERVTQELARWKRFGTPLALLVWDVDKFKNINDQYGHKAGDKVLKVIAGTLADNIRETDFLARYGGEEFVLLMTGTTQPAILEVAEKLRQAVEVSGFHYRGEDVPITISCGIAEFRSGDSIEAVFERADRALYRAKDEGRNRCVLADSEI